MKSNLAKKTEAVIKIASLTEARKDVKQKIREDLFRFRTCCADPRASK